MRRILGAHSSLQKIFSRRLSCGSFFPINTLPTEKLGRRKFLVDAAWQFGHRSL